MGLLQTFHHFMKNRHRPALFSQAPIESLACCDSNPRLVALRFQHCGYALAAEFTLVAVAIAGRLHPTLSFREHRESLLHRVSDRSSFRCGPPRRLLKSRCSCPLLCQDWPSNQVNANSRCRSFRGQATGLLWPRLQIIRQQPRYRPAGFDRQYRSRKFVSTSTSDAPRRRFPLRYQHRLPQGSACSAIDVWISSVSRCARPVSGWFAALLPPAPRSPCP